MKGSLVTSTTLHALLIGFALTSFSGPKTLEVTELDALPVDIVPIEELTQIQQGDKKAPLAEKAAPKPTERPDPVPDAVNTGDNTVDLKPAENATPAPREVVAEAPPKPAEKPAPDPEPKPEPVKEAVKAPPPPTARPEPKPEPAPKPQEVASLPAEPQPDPVSEAIAAAPQETEAPAAPKEEFAALPASGPVPVSRPQPQREQPKQAESGGSTKKSDFNADEVAALLNKEKAQGGGAKRSQQTASLGGERTTRGERLSQSEMDALRGQIQKYWNIIPGMADGGDVRVTVKMRLDRDGNIVGEPEVSASGGSAGTRGTLAGSARRAVLRAQPYTLPKEKYDAWADVIVNFDPSQMF